MKVSLIVAMAQNRVIGRDNGLPWRLRSDLARFKRLTMDHHLLLGRKTYDSIGRPLPGRTMVVITRDREWQREGVQVVHSVDAALRLAQDAGEREAFVGGGGEIYRQTLPLADRIYLTQIHEEIEGDAFFPDFDLAAWREVEREDREPDARNPHRYSFITLEPR